MRNRGGVRQRGGQGAWLLLGAILIVLATPMRGGPSSSSAPDHGQARLARLATFLGTEHEQWALRQAYELAPRANFSRAVLERSPQRLAVMRLSAVAWRDLGTPRRVIETLDELGIRPDWLAALG